MYEYIRGKVVEINPALAVIEANGIAYSINITVHTYSQAGLNSESLLYLHHVVREDAQLLFGFSTKEERSIFRLLISVSGIGANTARMMLSSLNPLEIQKAIAEGNVNVLKGVKGIGLKTAQRVIVDLKDKIGLESTSDEKFLFANNRTKEEALSALVTLGFAKSTVDKLLDKFLAAKPDMAVEELIKQTLKNV